MSSQQPKLFNNNKDTQKLDEASRVKVFEVTTDVNEIITIKKEPHDFFEYTSCATEPVAVAKAVTGGGENKFTSDIESSSHEESGVQYQIETWNCNNIRKTKRDEKTIFRPTKAAATNENNQDKHDIEIELDEEDEQNIDISDFDEYSDEEDENGRLEVSIDNVVSDGLQESPSTTPDIEDDEEEEEEEVSTTTEFNGMKIESKGQYSICPVCNKKIKSTFIFRHIKLHNQPSQKYPCPEKRCELVVNRINNLFRHLKVVHASKRPYLCKYEGCKERFSKSATLRTHLAVHRAETKKLQAEKDTPNEEEGLKKFTCEFPGCGKEYGKRHHLKEHERKHTGDMRFSCEVCGKKFYMHAHMKRHLYSHTGIKPHVCRWKCGAIFASYGGRMKHERINHYEENPLQRFYKTYLEITYQSQINFRYSLCIHIIKQFVIFWVFF